MLSFKEARDTIQQRYKLNIAEANETAKSILEDAKIPFMNIKINNVDDLNNYFNELEKQG